MYTNLYKKIDLRGLKDLRKLHFYSKKKITKNRNLFLYNLKARKKNKEGSNIYYSKLANNSLIHLQFSKFPNKN